MTWDVTCEKWAEMVIRVKPREPEIPPETPTETPPPPPVEVPAQSASK